MRLIDADALKREQMKAFDCENATKYGNKNAKQQEHSYSTIMLYEVSDIIEDTIDNAPTVEERPHGKWIYHKDWYRDEECPWECSECGTCSDNNMNFCGECGADMMEADK